PARDEAFGLAPLEAMACGCPVVLADEPGFRQYAVPDVNALLVNDAEPAGMAEVLVRLLVDRPLATRLREQGPLTAARFSVETTVERYLSLYQTLRAARERPGSHRDAHHLESTTSLRR